MNEKQKWLIEKAEELGWSCHIYDDGIEFEKGSPAGEDFIFSISGEDIEEEVREFADEFDTEDHVKGLLDAKESGLSGVPSLKVLVEDADAIKKMLEELSDGLTDAEGEFWDIAELPEDPCEE